MICASEQSVTVVGDAYKAVKDEFAYRGCYFLKEDELDKVRHTIMINGARSVRRYNKGTGRPAPIALPAVSAAWRGRANRAVPAQSGRFQTGTAAHLPAAAEPSV